MNKQLQEELKRVKLSMLTLANKHGGKSKTHTLTSTIEVRVRLFGTTFWFFLIPFFTSHLVEGALEREIEIKQIQTCLVDIHTFLC